MHSAADTNRLIPCKTDASCRTKFVRDFGLKAFRRPLEAKKIERYSKLFDGQQDFISGAHLVVKAMLQSPNFLFRVERGGDARAYETGQPPLLLSLGAMPTPPCSVARPAVSWILKKASISRSPHAGRRAGAAVAG